MTITYMEFLRMMHVQDEESRLSEDIVFPSEHIVVKEWATHVENIEWSRWSLSTRVNICLLLVWMCQWLMIGWFAKLPVA